jgi:hypothetical protein
VPCWLVQQCLLKTLLASWQWHPNTSSNLRHIALSEMGDKIIKREKRIPQLILNCAAKRLLLGETRVNGRLQEERKLWILPSK